MHVFVMQVLFGLVEDIAKRLAPKTPAPAPATGIGLDTMPSGQRLAQPDPYTLPKPDPDFQQQISRWLDHETVESGQIHRAAGTKEIATSPTTASKPKDQHNDDTGPLDSSQNNNEEGLSTWMRWMLFCIAAPLLVIISVAGLVLWVLFLPLRFLCPLCGCPAYALINAVEALMKLPLRAMLWASAKKKGPKGAVVRAH